MTNSNFTFASLPEGQHRTISRKGAYAVHAKYDARYLTSAARKGFAARFERQVDPDGTLPPDERQRRAQAALRAHMQDLAFRSQKARRRRR
jgi:hypothetical protein